MRKGFSGESRVTTVGPYSSKYQDYGESQFQVRKLAALAFIPEADIISVGIRIIFHHIPDRLTGELQLLYFFDSQVLIFLLMGRE